MKLSQPRYFPGPYTAKKTFTQSFSPIVLRLGLYSAEIALRLSRDCRPPEVLIAQNRVGCVSVISDTHRAQITIPVCWKYSLSQIASGLRWSTGRLPYCFTHSLGCSLFSFSCQTSTQLLATTVRIGSRSSYRYLNPLPYSSCFNCSSIHCWAAI